MGGAGLIIDVIRFVVVAVLIKLARLLRCIQIGQQLGRERKSGRFIMAFRGGLPAKATIGRCTIPIRIGLSDQLGEFCMDRVLGDRNLLSAIGLLGFVSRPEP